MCGMVTFSPTKPSLGSNCRRLGQVGVGDVHRDVVALDPIAPQPVAVQRGRAAVGDRMADDAGKRDAGHVGHDANEPSECQVGQERQKRQAQNGEVVAFDGSEQPDAFVFELVAADGVAKRRASCGRGRRRDRRRRSWCMVRRASPIWRQIGLASSIKDEGGEQLVGLAAQGLQLGAGLRRVGSGLAKIWPLKAST